MDSFTSYETIQIIIIAKMLISLSKQNFFLGPTGDLPERERSESEVGVRGTLFDDSARVERLQGQIGQSSHQFQVRTEFSSSINYQG